MKRIPLLFILMLFIAFSSFGQTIIIQENFDSFTAGDKIVQTINDQNVWDTWSSSPGGSEDVAISDKFASSVPNSIYLANNNDIVLLFNDIVEGRYQFKFKVLIESGGMGYFNLLNDFAGGNSVWAFQAYFNPNGQGDVDAGGASVAQFAFDYDTWMDVNIIIDMNTDFATFYFNDSEVVSWKFSSGTGGAGSLQKLDAVNFYGYSSGASSKMYIDDVEFSEVLTPESPSELKATIIDDSQVALSWTAPSTAPDSYVLIRNGEIIASDITETEYLDIPYPGTGVYSVRAHTNGLGYSNSSNEVTAEIPGGFDREYVLFEIGTGTGCVFCPGAAMGAKDMEDNGDEVIIIKYHNFNSDDPFNSVASTERAGNYYGITGYPTSFADGTLSIAGGNPNNSLYEQYHNHYLQRKAKKSLYTLDATVFHLQDNNYRAVITIEEHSGFNGEAKTLHTALTESEMDFTWFNQDQVHWACRDMYPDAMGTSVDFSEEPSHTFQMDFTMEESWIKENSEFVVFLQADPSKEVMVATKVDMADVLLNDENLESNKILKIYPNPVNNWIIFNQDVNDTYSILDISGKTVQQGKAEDRIQVSGLTSGFYFLKVGDHPVQKITIE